MKLNFKHAGIPDDVFTSYQDRISAALRKLEAGEDGFTGWRDLPAAFDEAELARILAAAEKIRNSCDVLVIIGIGGSYLGAKACIEMMGHSFNQLLGKEQRNGPRIFFAGQNLSGTYHAELLDVIENKEVCLCVISKSGTTTEPNIAFSILKEMMTKKYGTNAKDRIFAITDLAKGTLREETDREGYESFVIPDDIGGRYSVLTPVGLLPIAAAGIDVKEILRGALDGKQLYDHPKDSSNSDGCSVSQNPCLQYAVVRDYLSRQGKCVEIFACYEPKIYFFGEWLKQLFGESEGKDGKGIFPALLQFTTDLHSMGQFIQEGSQIFFETVLNVESPEKDLVIPPSSAPAFRGKTLNQVNQAAVKGVAEAHASDQIPVISIDIPALTPYYFGKMVYFFELSCAVRGYMMEVNPFNQPGVEKYKAYMKEALNESI